MLYSSFRVIVVICAILGLLHMIAEGSFIYILFPIAIVVWGLYSFFDENDKEYLRRNGIDPDEISWFFPDYNDYGAVRDSYSSPNRRSYPARTNNSYNTNAQYSRYAPQGQYPYKTYYNQDYKGFVSKCKRNFKITVYKGKETKDDGTSES